MESWAEQPPREPPQASPPARPAPPPRSRLVIAGTDLDRVIHIQDLATLRDPAPQDGLVEITIGGETCHVAILEGEAVIVVTVRQGEQYELAGCIVTLLGPLGGEGR
jgi:hypothetical protein